MAFDQLIRVGITGDGVQLANALNAASSQVEGFARRATSSLARMSVLFGGLSFVGLTAGVKSAIDAFDEMNKAAQKTGTSVRTLSALRYAAEQADVPFETLQKGLQKFAKTLDAARGGSKEATQALSALGISSRSGLEQGLLGVADAFAKMPDGARKVALSLQLFGKAGAELIPFLNQGRDGIAALMAEAERLGVVMDEQTAQAAEKFNDALNTVSKSATAVGLALANNLLPGLSDVATRMRDATVSGQGFLGVVNAFVDASTNWALFGSGKEGLEGQLDELQTKLREAETEVERWRRIRDGLEEESIGSRGRRAVTGQTTVDMIESWGAIAAKARPQITALRGELLQLSVAEDRAAGAGGSLDDALEANRVAAEEAAKSLASYKKVIDDLQQGQRAANANPILKTGSTVLDVNRMRDLAQNALGGGDARTALEYIDKARQINDSLLAAGSITKGYYLQQSQLLLELAKAGQEVVDGKPIAIPAAPDLASAVAAGQLAWAAAQQGATQSGPIVIPGVVQLSGNSFGDAASSGNYSSILQEFQRQNPEWTPQYAGGGVVSGPGTGTSDSVLARLSRGEFVMPAWVTDRMRSTLEYMRSFGRLPRFASGGMVGAGAGSERFSIELGGHAFPAYQEPEVAAAMQKALRLEVVRRGRR